jgi:hypothetical protein
VADGWCWFVLREEYCWLVAGGWFVLRGKHCWLVADKPSEQAVDVVAFRVSIPLKSSPAITQQRIKARVRTRILDQGLSCPKLSKGS